LSFSDPRRDLALGAVAFAGSTVSKDGTGQLDLQGLELNVQKRLVDDNLTFMAAAMLTYFNDSGALLTSGPLYDGQKTFNFAGYFGLNYRNPTFLNADLFLRYAGNGDHLHQELIRRLNSPLLLDAKIWRDWSLSPTLTLSTQLSGSSLADEYWLSYLGQNSSGPYLESRVTMSYSF
jgi:hypothetical protein